MKQVIMNFCKRGMVAAWGGPVVMALIYGILGITGVVQSVSIWELCSGILSVTFMAFLAAGIGVVYEIDRLPLMGAIALHSGVLYLDYIGIYLINGWLKSQFIPILIFTGIFLAGYAVIWLCIWLVTKKSTAALNTKLKKNQG